MIKINYRDSRPLYEQIREQLRYFITTRKLGTNEKLPSIRKLSSQLSINPNTIQRAYRELESEGYVYMVPGRGTFVAEVSDSILTRKNELMKSFDKQVTELLYLSVTKEELMKRICELEKRD